MPYLVMGLLGTVVGVIVGMRQIAKETKVSPATTRHDADHAHDWQLRSNHPAINEPAPEPPRTAPIVAKSEVMPAKTEVPATPVAAVPEVQTRLTGLPISYQMAHAALALVGSDPDAEEYWLRAINDPNLPAQERKNLIEDLNEAGFIDPKRPTIDELPLILARIQLIETIEPHVTDRVNAAAFREAYNDLLQLAEVALSGETAVR